MLTSDIVRYIIAISFANNNGKKDNTYYTGIDNNGVHSTKSVWSAQKYYFIDEAIEDMNEAKKEWPEAEYSIRKITVEEKDLG